MTTSELAIINFSPAKYVDAATLSRIRSHAQQSVQDQKLQALTLQSDPNAVRRKGSKTEQECLNFVFDRKSGKEIRRAPRTRPLARGGKPRRRTPGSDSIQDEDQAVIARSNSPKSGLSTGNGDPFDAFPEVIDNDFALIFDDYYVHWQWCHPKATLFNEILSHPVAYYSFLAVGYDIWRQDEVKSLINQNKALTHIQKGIQQLQSTSTENKSALACSLIWAMMRLAVMCVNHGQLETSWQHLSALLRIVFHGVEDWSVTKFASHLHSSIASLLLANFAQSSKNESLLRSPRMSIATSAVQDVQTCGFVVPETALLFDDTFEDLIQTEVRDALLALTAVYNTCDDCYPTPSNPDPGYGTRTLESVKIALRLANINAADTYAVDATEAWRVEFQECVRLTALLFTWGFGRRIANRNTAISFAQQYTRTYVTPQLICLVLNSALNSTSISDLILWMLIVCGSTSSRTEDKLYFAGTIRCFFPHTITWMFMRAKDLGKKLPWLDTKHRTPVVEFWSLVTGKPLRNKFESEWSEPEPEPHDARFLYNRGWIRTSATSVVDHMWSVAPVVDLSGHGVTLDTT